MHMAKDFDSPLWLIFGDFNLIQMWVKLKTSWPKMKFANIYKFKPDTDEPLLFRIDFEDRTSFHMKAE